MIGILGAGSALGSHVQTNADLCRTLPMSEEWIVAKTGIRQRRQIAQGESASTLALLAAQRALEAADVAPEEIGLTIVATYSGDYLCPSAANQLHHDLGLVGGRCFDLQANCAGFVTALGVAAELAHRAKALVVGVEIQSPYLDPTDPNTAPYFADGAGAVVLGWSDAGLISQAWHTESADFAAVSCKRGGMMFQDGHIAGKAAIGHLPRVVRQALAKARWDIEDVDCFIFHQANLRLIEFLAGVLKIPMGQVFTNVENIGNTSAASIPIALTEAMATGRIKHGDRVVFAAIGAGFNFGASCWVMP